MQNGIDTINSRRVIGIVKCMDSRSGFIFFFAIPWVLDLRKMCPEEKKDFLVLFFKRKLLEMGTKQATARTLGEEKLPERKPKKSVRFK